MKEMWTIKFAFNFEGMKHKASISCFPTKIDKNKDFINFFKQQIEVVISKLQKK